MATALNWPPYIRRPHSVVSTAPNSGTDCVNGDITQGTSIRPNSFMSEYEYNRAHVADAPEAFENSIRTILAALA